MKRSLCLNLLVLLFLWPLQALCGQIPQYDYNQINSAQTLLSDGQPQQAKTQMVKFLADLGNSSQRRYSKALAQLVLGRSALALNENKQALKAFSHAYHSHQLAQQQSQSLLLTIAQLQLNLKKWQLGVNSLNSWLKITPAKEHQANHYYLLSYGYYELNSWNKGLHALKTALQMKPSASTNWYQLGIAIAIHLKNWTIAQDWQRVVVMRSPNQINQWQQLASLELRAKHPKQALASMRMAWQNNLFSRSEHYQLLMQLAASQHIPYLAAQVMEDGFAKKKLKRTKDNLQQWADLLNQARQYKQALAPLKELAARFPSKEHYQNYLSTLLVTHQWQQVIKLQQQAKRYHADSAQLQLDAAIAACQIKKFNLAKKLFEPLTHHPQVSDQAHAWLSYIQQLNT
ncbi:tetratricopeptide repeat protein [Celerinatantimonas diazotrophica]|uniref:Uncharacterized protein n=1 Tax=Celerinatantimonas diazotrophica TaxID=412034 RepID=A0A4R1JMK7_9GAMM|nr:hypothetical protein [Celerinatantimonas diazotrophica]TCK52190.1 hypothetical protein EV690_2298 [Celerinatantimonas diazotrophica]CAG9296105.1 hypothetical protein CEDIAZO_01248 [Celerinatantimonas diazotrophica]